MNQRPTSITVFSIFNLIILGFSGIIFLVGFFRLLHQFSIISSIITLLLLGATITFIIGCVKSLQQKKLGFILTIIYASLGIIAFFFIIIVTLLVTLNSISQSRNYGLVISSSIVLFFYIGLIVYFIFNLKVFIKHKSTFS